MNWAAFILAMICSGLFGRFIPNRVTEDKLLGMLIGCTGGGITAVVTYSILTM